MRKPTRRRYQRRIAELESALAPFAATARALTWARYDEQPIITGTIDGSCVGATWRDFKRAAAAMPEAAPASMIHAFLAPDGRLLGAPVGGEAL